MKKSFYHTLLFIFSVALSILMILFSSNGWGFKVDDIIYIIQVDFDPNTQHFLNGHVKVLKADDNTDISTLTTSDGKNTHLAIDNDASEGGIIKLITIKESLTVGHRTFSQICENQCQEGKNTTDLHVDLNRESSKISVTLSNQGSSAHTVQFYTWLTDSSIAQVSNWSAIKNYIGRITGPNLVSSCNPSDANNPLSINGGYRKNCWGTSQPISIKPTNPTIVTGSMTMVFDELKDKLASSTVPAGLYQGSVDYNKDYLEPKKSEPDKKEKYTLKFRVHKLPKNTCKP